MDVSDSRVRIEFNRPKKANFIKVRFTIALLATLCPVVCYISRQNLPLAIVSMIEDENDTQKDNQPILPEPILPSSILSNDLGILNDTILAVDVTKRRNVTISSSNKTTSSATNRSPSNIGTCPEPNILNEQDRISSKGYGPKYPWTAEDKGILLSAFFYTYVLCQIPGARLAERMGAKWILVTATLGSAILSLLSPWAASVHVHLLSLIRLLMGVCQAALYPTCYVLYSKWLPPVERSQALPILCTGAYVGSIIASSLTGFFSEQPKLGWEYSFYLPGVLCALWTLCWILVATNEPREHPTISVEELVYIESKMESSRQVSSCDSKAAPIRPQISWRKLFQSKSIWAMMVAFFASNWSFTIVLLLIPTYLNDILYVSPLNNGIINSIIYALYCVASPLVGSGSTMMVETRACGLSRLNIRKLFQGIALFGQAICFAALPLLGCDQNFVFGILYVQIILFSFVNGGEVQLPTELSVDFSGTIYAIGNCVGSSTGFIVPLIHSLIVTNRNSRTQWDLYFYLAAIISALGGLVFILFGGNHLQDFSKDLGESQLNICKLSDSKSMNSNFDLEEATNKRPLGNSSELTTRRKR